MNKSHIVSVLLVAIALVSGFAGLKSVSAQTQDYTEAAKYIKVISLTSDGKAVVENTSTSKSFTVGLASYKMYDNNLENQTLFDKDVQSIGPKQKVTLTVDMPSCAFQLDLFYGDAIVKFRRSEGSTYHDQNRFIASKYSADSVAYCPKTVTPPPTCTDPDPERDLVGSLTGVSSGTVTNKSKVCSYPVGLASYKMPDSNISHQTSVFDSELKTIAPNTTITLTVDVPACAYQIDLFYGDLITTFANGARYDGRKLAAEQRVNNNYCVTVVPAPKLEISKSAPSSINKGDDITFTITVKNTGNAEAKNVVITDVIQDGLTFKSVNPVSTCSIIAGRTNDIECKFGSIATGATKTFTVTFKTATSLSCECKINNRAEVKADGVVAVKSNTTETTVKCVPVTPPAFTVSCVASAAEVKTGENVTFTSTTNATGTKTYSWSGTNDLTGSASSVTKSYTATGTKTATVEVTSQGVTKSATCSTLVKAPVVVTPSNPKAYCVVSPSSAKIGDKVTWTASATGGSGTGYKYVWVGTGGFSATTSVATTSYSIAGKKYSSVTVTDSNGKSDSVECDMTVTEVPVTVSNPAVSCVANPTSGIVGTNVTYTATATGGNGSYVYAWTGTDSLTGSSSSVSKTYNTLGSKDATVTVTSNGKTATATCSTNIINNPPPVTTATFDATCVVTPSNPNINQTVTFRVDPFGGSNGVYTYSWSGDEGISGTGQSVSKAFTTTGVKNAIVVITSGNRSITKTCGVTISSNVSVTTATPNQVAGVYLTQVPYTGVRENAIAALSAIVAIGSLGFIAFAYFKKNNELAYAAVAPVATVKAEPSAAETAAVLSSAIESYARSQSASISADAVDAITKASKGNVDWAKSVINQVVSAHEQNEWTLITLDSIKKIYPHLA